MNKDQFENSITQFNKILVNHLSGSIVRNYVRSSSISSFIYMKVIPRRESSDEPESINESENKEKSTEFTIHYDAFYTVPILSFRVDQQLTRTNTYTGVDIHPILQIPYLYMHPCETQAIMDTIPTEDAVEYLKKWLGIVLSVVLPDLELRIPTG